MKTMTRALGAALAIAAALAQQGCDNSYGIFDEVQKEREQEGQEIFLKKAVSSIVLSDGYYYAATAKLYRRPVAGSSWTKVDAIGGYSDYFVYGLAALGTHVYVSIATNDGYQGVFDLSDDSLVANSPSNGEALYVAGGELFLSNHSVDDSDPVQSTYSLLHLGGSGFEPVQNFAPAADMSIRGVAWDGLYYYFASEDLLARASDPDGTSPDAAFADFSKVPSSASTCANGAYIGTTDGYLYRYSNGVEQSAQVTSIPVTAAVEVPLDAGSSRLLVGTGSSSASDDSLGYFESADDATTALASMTFESGEDGAVAYSSSIYSTTVDDLAVNAFLYDTAQGTLLIGLSSYTSTGIHYGLYSSKWNGSSWSEGWEAE
jgi:hypothetical protein